MPDAAPGVLANSFPAITSSQFWKPRGLGLIRHCGLRLAFHEAGHALAALRLGVSTDITISIISNGSTGGRMIMQESTAFLTQPMVEGRLVVLLAGRAAEDVALNSISSGAGGSEDSDLARATDLAFNAVGTLGLSSRDNLVWYGSSGLNSQRVYPGPVADEAKTMLRDAYERARQLMEGERDLLGAIATALLTKRALTHREIVAIKRFTFRTRVKRP